MDIENNILFEDLRSQIIYLGVVRGFFLLYLYSFLAGALEWLFGTKKYKKEKKKHPFYSRLLFSGFRECLPKPFLVFYFIVLISYPVCLLISVIFNYVGFDNHLGEMTAKTACIFDSIWIIIMLLFASSRDRDRTYKRWFVNKNK